MKAEKPLNTAQPMARRRPLIGVSAESPIHSPWQAFAEALFSIGAEPLLLTPESENPEVSALLLSGGGDVHPSCYGEEERVPPRRLSRVRDELELSLCRKALKENIPLLGVCRGMQVLAVAAGGKLFQHIASDLPEALKHDAQGSGNDLGHLVQIEPNSRLAGVLGAQACFVNTAHHQAPSALGGGLIASASSLDGVIEAVEAPSAVFIIGVGWHPERMWDFCPAQKRLIEGLVEAARQTG
jgi:putative glutamine amidotransferase